MGFGRGLRFRLGSAIFGMFLTFGSLPAMAQTVPPTNTPSHSIPSAADFATKAGTSFTLSPSGQKLAFLTGEGVSAKVVLIDINSGQLKNINLGDKTKPRSVKWAGDNYLLITVGFFFDGDEGAKNSNYRYEVKRTVSYSLLTGRTVLMVPHPDLHNNAGLGIRYINQNNPSTIIMSAYMERERAGFSSEVPDASLAYFNASLETGRGSRITIGSESTVDFVLDTAGQPRLRIDSDVAKRTSSLLRLDNRTWKPLLEYSDTSELPFDIEGFLDAQTLLIVQEKDGIKKPQKLDIYSGQFTPIFENETRSISSIIMDPYKHEPLGLVYDNFLPQVKWLTPEMARFQSLLERAFPNKYVFIRDWDKDKKNLIVAAESGDSLFTHYLFNTEKLSAEQLSLFPEGFDNFKFAPKTIEKMTSSDGLEITVLVTKPNNSNNRKMPAIIMPHGGPEGNDDPGFDYMSQFLASRGYVVIQPQFRGSTGFGSDFAQKGYGEWAGKMQSDVNDTVKWASDKGWIDKDRVCIVGASYGGYSALVGVAHTPDLYKCAASFGGVFDLAELQKTSLERGGFKSASLAYWKEHIGYSRFDKEKIRAISPLFQAQNVKVPVLLMHGVEDTVVPIKQSRDMERALKREGKAVQLIEFEREDHWLSRQETREQFLVELEKFLAPILKPEIN